MKGVARARGLSPEGLVRDRSKLSAMISSEVQRTLVKSPPELWAEISDPESLARHLGEFGEIRITRVHPEQKIEWEGESASGTVVIKPSGWGTKVKLTVTRELSLEADVQPSSDENAASDAVAETSYELDDEPALESGPATVAEPRIEPELPAESTTAADRAIDPELAAEPAPELELERSVDVGWEPDAEPAPELSAEPTPRRGFFARLFGRRRSSPSEAESCAAPEAEPFAPEPVPDAEPARETALAVEREPLLADPLTPSPERWSRAESDERADRADEDEAEAKRGEIAAELAAAEEVAAEQVTAVLTSVLDRLGAAHHRPFSRS